MNDIIRDCVIDDLKKENQQLKEQVSMLLKQIKTLRKILKNKGWKDPAVSDPIPFSSDICGDLFKGGGKL